MVAIKANAVDAFLKSPDRSIEAVLVFGPDAGLVSERARDASMALAKRSNPPGEIIRLEDADLDQDPDRLAVEVRTIPMFGGPKVVRTTASRLINAQRLAALVNADGGLASALVVEAGNLKADEALRALFEKSPRAAALPCYADEGKALSDLVAEVLGAHKLQITPDARGLLLARLGADRALSRGEIEKLALYCQGKGTIEPADVDAIVGDASEQTIERILVAMASGRGAAAVVELDRALSSGENAQAIISAAQRYLHRLHRVRSAIDDGRSMEDALRALRPPLHFKARDAFTSQLRTWTTRRLDTALDRSATALKLARLNTSLEAALTERLLLEVAHLAGVGR